MDISRVTDVTMDRFDTNPLITPDSCESLGANINGPSVIRVPSWISNPLGRYYMYFAHHEGEHIRLAYGDDLTGPWTVHTPGTLKLGETRFTDHIASPDIHVNIDSQTIVKYFHGCCGKFIHGETTFTQVTDVATSSDGLSFNVVGRSLGTSYFRVWSYEGTYYALANDGYLYRSEDPFSTFERAHQLFPVNRHFAVRFIDESHLQIFLTRRGDRPERIMVTGMDLSLPEEEWKVAPHPPETVLWPRRGYEGGTLPLTMSQRGAIYEPVRELRDPAVFHDDGRDYMFYSIAGERGIAGAYLK